MKSLMLSLVLSTSVIAFDKPALLDQEKTDTNHANILKEEILEKLFTSLGQTEFDTAYINAQQAGIHPQALLEARFLNLVDLGDNSAIANLAPELIKNQQSFNPNHSEVFVIKDDWAAIVHYAQALAALEKNDTQAFKRHITEAFWLSPRQAQAYGPHIEKLRREQAMRSIQLPLQQTLMSQKDQALTALAKHTAGSRAVILYFWNPMSQAIQLELPDFITTTKTCHENNISVLAILTGKYPAMIDDAETIRKDDAAQAKCIWLIDSNKDSLSSLLWVRSLPTMIVASADGQVLFNGHPSDENFWKTLEKLSPGFQRPNSIEK
ncbi:MAG: hypothetical protein P8P36_06540 [Akkermansiaceae bacterium]|nr:hypothetical protein [Akkermansiaceae bacterium]